MKPVYKFGLAGLAGAVAIWAVWPKKTAIVVSPPPPPPPVKKDETPVVIGPGQVPLDVSNPIAADAIIDPVSRTLTPATVATMDNWFEHYYVATVIEASPNTRIFSATLMPAGQVPQDPNNVLSTAALNVAKLGWNVLVTKDVGDAGLLNKVEKMPSNLVLSVTKDAAAMQETLHKGGYIFRSAVAAAAA
jgi:hypothetical protein